MSEEFNNQEEELIKESIKEEGQEEISIYEEVPDDVEVKEEDRLKCEYADNLGLEVYNIKEYPHEIPGTDKISTLWARSKDIDDNKFIAFSGINCELSMKVAFVNALSEDHKDISGCVIVEVFRNGDLLYRQQDANLNLLTISSQIFDKIATSPLNFADDEYAKNIKYRKVYFMNQPGTIVAFNNDNYNLELTIIPDNAERFSIYGREFEDKEIKISALDDRLHIVEK